MFNTIIKSREGLILRFMREERKLSLPIVSKVVGFKAAEIDHMEKGNKILTEESIHKFLLYYKFSIETFNELKEIKILTKHVVNLYFLKNKK